MQGGGLADGSERVYGFGADQMHRFAAQAVMTTTVHLFAAQRVVQKKCSSVRNPSS